MRLSRIALTLAVALMAAPAAAAQSAPGQAVAKTLVNVDRQGLAVQGYDPVAFHTQRAALKGDPAITATHLGATYRFASAANKAAFEADPARYAPAYGGYCAYGVSQGGLFPVDIATAQILDGRLILNKTPRVRELFDRDPQGRIRLAETEWPDLVAKHGKARP